MVGFSIIPFIAGLGFSLFVDYYELANAEFDHFNKCWTSGPFPGTNGDRDARVQVYVGSTLDGKSELDGNIPNIQLLDVDGNDVGRHTGKGVQRGEGSIMTFQLCSKGKDKTAEYMYIFPSKDDAICISAIVYIDSDHERKIVWTGDWALTCAVGRDDIGIRSDSYTSIGDTHHKPACVWLDSDHSKGNKNTGFLIHLPSWDVTKEKLDAWNSDWPSIYCTKSPRFDWFTADDFSFGKRHERFIPRLDFHERTRLDKDPERILNWQRYRGNPNYWKDWMARAERRLTDSRRKRNDNTLTSSNRVTSASQAFSLALEELRSESETSLLPNLTLNNQHYRRPQDSTDNNIDQSTPKKPHRLRLLANTTTSAAAYCTLPDISQEPDLFDGKKYCHTSTGSVYPVCSEKNEFFCFDKDTHTLTRVSKFGIAEMKKRNLASMAVDGTTEDWGMNRKRSVVPFGVVYEDVEHS